MKTLIFMILSLSIFVTNGYSASKIDNVSLLHEPLSQKNNNWESIINRMSDDIKELRRDQLNYKIEKDLLKEMYTSNLQIINVIITIIVAVFGFIGFFGLKDIYALQKSYKTELDKLNNIKSDFQLETKNILDDQIKAKDSFQQLLKISEGHNTKIKMLELRDKVTDSIKDNKYATALEYCVLALQIDNKDIQLNNIKGHCQIKMKQNSEAIKTYLYSLEIDDSDLNARVNLCELYLLSNNIVQFNNLYTNIKQEINEIYKGIVNTYFEALKFYIEGNDIELKKLLATFLSSCEPGKKKRTRWGFEEVEIFLKDRPAGAAKEIISNLTSFLKGEKEIEDVTDLLTL